MPVISAGDQELFYEREGAGPPLLAIMGMSGSHLSWGEPFLAQLRRDFDVVVYDHRGVGESTRLDGEFSIADLAADAVALLDALDIDAAHVLGISMGGMVAQELALTHRERVLSLTLGCTYCGGAGARLTSEHVWQRLADALGSGDRERSLRTAWEVNVSERFAADDRAYGAFRRKALELPVAVPVILAQARAVLGHDTSRRLAGLTVPTLIVHGDRDQMLDVVNARVIAGAIPGARLRLMEGVGHLFFWEQPEVAAQLVREHADAAGQPHEAARLKSPRS